MSSSTALTHIDDSLLAETHLEKVASGKVRELYAVDDKSLLFVATDRISAYDVVLNNGIPDKGRLLAQLSLYWFSFISTHLPNAKTHIIPRDQVTIWDHMSSNTRSILEPRSMLVRKLRVLPIESIVRGYITGSAWEEYKRSGTVHGQKMPAGLQECEKLASPLWTVSTKAEAGDKDENISLDAAKELIGERYAARVEELSLSIYTEAQKHAADRGIIIADTKFEFGVDEQTDEVVLIDEVLTPDSSRFWPAASYEVGRGQDSFDKQYLRDWLVANGLKAKENVEIPQNVVEQTRQKYIEAFELLTDQKWTSV